MKWIKRLWIALLMIVLSPLGCLTDNSIQQATAHHQNKPLQTMNRSQGSSEQPIALEVPAEYPMHPGFPIYYDKWTERSSVTIADIDNNGSRELLLPTFTGEIFAWDASGGLLPGFPLTTGWQINGRLALGDLNHDGNLEIAAGLESSSDGVSPRVSIWLPNGTLLPGWPQITACARSDESCGIAEITFADLDKDSNLEVIAATDNRDLTSSDPSLYVPNLYVWESNGALAAGSWPNEDDHNVAIIGQMAVGDLDGDTYPDIVFGRDYNRLFALNRLGANLINWPHYVWWPFDNNNWDDDQIEFPRSSPALADLDRDGKLEYIIPGHRRHVTSATYFATELLIYTSAATRWPGWELPAEGSSFVSGNTTKMIEAPAIGDLTGDGQPEIVLATQDGYVRAYTAEKQVLWAYDYAQGKEIQASETLIGDVDGDGWNDVVFGTFAVQLGSVGPVGVYILDQNGSPKAGTPLWVASPGISSTPALGDLDSDGLIEIAAAAFSGWVYVWDAPGQALSGRMPWPMARHDLQRTGRYLNPEPDFSHSTKTSNNPAPAPGETVTYSIHLIQSGSPINDAIHLTDTLPDGLSYISGSLSATSGQVDDSQAPTLSWSGVLMEASQVTITYSTKVEAGATGMITNTANVDAGSGGYFNRSATIFVNGFSIYLPWARR